jgi:hypothetical protein
MALLSVEKQDWALDMIKPCLMQVTALLGFDTSILFAASRHLHFSLVELEFGDTPLFFYPFFWPGFGEVDLVFTFGELWRRETLRYAQIQHQKSRHFQDIICSYNLHRDPLDFPNSVVLSPDSLSIGAWWPHVPARLLAHQPSSPEIAITTPNTAS